MSKRIGVDASILVKLYGGVSYYVFYLLDELIRLKKEWQFFLYAPKDAGDIEHFKQYSNVTIRALPYLAHKNVTWHNVILPIAVRKDRLDAFWATVYLFRFFMPKKIKMFVTVYDFVAQLFPETMGTLHKFYCQSITKHALKSADHVFPISQGTHERMQNFLGYSKRVGVDASILVKLHGGVSYYVFYLLDELVRLKTDWHFFLYAPEDSGDIQHFKQYKNVTIRSYPYFSYKNAIWRNLVLPFVVRKDRLYAFWETVYLFRFLMPRKVKHFVTVHDFVAYLFPETMSTLHGFYHKCVTKHALESADFLFLNSQGTEKRLHEFFKLKNSTLIYPPSKPEMFYRERSAVQPFLEKQDLHYNQYLVTVGTWEPRKNFVFLARLYLHTLEKYGPDNVMPLVVIGGRGWKNQEIQKEFFALQKKHPTHFKIAGYCSDAEIALYLSGAKYYLCLSLYEGYGMPVREARQCRTPIIALDVPEIREAAENEGIFLAQDKVENELPKFMLKTQPSLEEKPAFTLNYPTNRESAEKMAAVMENSKRIAIDASILSHFQGGITPYVFYFLDELIQQRPHDHFFLYTPVLQGDILHFQKYKNVTMREVRFLSIKNVLWRNITLPLLMRKDRIDVYWQTLLHWPGLIPRRIKITLTVYDFVPQLFPKTLSWPQRLYGKAVTASALHRAFARIAISEATARKLQELYKLPTQAIVYPPHKKDIFYRNSLLLAPFLEHKKLTYNNYVVTVGTWEPRKNFSLLVRMMLKALREYGPEKVMPLVVVGGGGWKNQAIHQAFVEAKNAYPEHFRIAGFVTDRVLSMYLSGAKYYLALSIYEGYGMPIAEARRCRTRPICTDTAEMREAAENDGIFLKIEEIETQLPSLLCKVQNAGEKAALKLSYSKNQESAAKIMELL